MGLKQFLLNPDGSIPEGADIAALKRAGVALVIPTPRHRPTAGMMLVEAEAEMRDGALRQVWLEVHALPPEPPTEDSPSG